MKRFILFLSLIVATCAHADIKDLLQNASNGVSSSIVYDVASQQVRQQKKMQLQFQISSLRNEIGATADAETKKLLQKKLTQLEMQRQNL